MSLSYKEPENIELNDYEKTIVFFLANFLDDPMFTLDEEKIYQLAAYLRIDSSHLLSLQNERKHIYQGIRSCMGSDYRIFIQIIYYLIFAYNTLSRIDDKTDRESLIYRINDLKDVYHFCTVINSYSDEIEYFRKNSQTEHMPGFEDKAPITIDSPIPYSNLVFNDSSVIFNYMKMMESIITCSDAIDFDLNLINIISSLLQYEFTLKINALALITACQMIKYSPYVSNKEMKAIADEFYSYLLFMLKNGRLISVSINSIPCDTVKAPASRTRDDNTTRLQLLYGYDNYDDYILRLDFSHEEQEFIHFNNVSPGKTKGFLLNNAEYEEIIAQNPDFKEFFINYGSQWALKERANIRLSNQQSSIYDEIQNSMDHKKIFSSYSESTVNDFLALLAKFLPQHFYRKIDTDGSYAYNLFNFDGMMNCINTNYLLQLVKMYLEDNSQSLLEHSWLQIYNKAFSFNFISSSDLNEIKSNEDLYYIILRAKETIESLS